MRWRAWLAWAAALWSGVAVAALSPEAFTQEYAARVRAALPGYTVEVTAPLRVRITRADGTEVSSYLENAYGEYRQDPESREDILARRVAAFVEVAVDPGGVQAADIVPIVKDRAWLTETNQAASAAGADRPPERVVEDLNDLLVIVYAEDTPRNIRYLSPADLQAAGVERAELRQRAVQNLRTRLPPIERHVSPEFTMLTAGGNYEACLLLFDELWEPGSFPVQGEIVVAIPSRDLLLVTGSRQPAGIAKLRELATQLSAESPYGLTAELFVRRQGRFVRFMSDR